MVLQNSKPGIIPQTTVDRWQDASIPKEAKTEALNKFKERFGYSSNRRWDILMKQDTPATPDQYDYLIELVDKYWTFFNPSSNGADNSTLVCDPMGIDHA